jgi:hypothetical protein
MADGKTLTAAQQASTTEGLFPNYQYEVIPLDISLDLAMLPNEYPVNFLLGASIGTAFVNMQLPIKSVTYYKDTTAREIHVYDNTWQTFNFLTGSAYAGARINLLRRLNLEAQAGWRLLRNSNLASDGDAWNALGGTKLQKDSTGAWIPYMPVLNALPIDLSGLYVRVDVRWTFASQADKEKVSLLQDRPRMMAERMALMPRRYTLD